MAEPEPAGLFHSPRGLYGFQLDHISYCAVRRDNLLCWDTGLGKSIAGMATSALLFETDEIDLVLLVCEQAKIEEWIEDFAFFTKLRAVSYVGTPARRAKILTGTAGRRKKGQAPDPFPQVLVSSFETFKADLVKKDAVDSRRLETGPLLERIRSLRVLVILDETSKIGRRSSGTHKAIAYTVKTLRENNCRNLWLTATPMERNPESFFNLGRILCPETMPTVDQFDKLYVTNHNFVGEPSAFANLEDFALRFKHVMLRKRKTDDDVRHQFPSVTEEFRHITLGPAHQEAYDNLHAVISDLDDPVAEQATFNTMRQLAGHPLALLKSKGIAGRAVAEAYGADGLEKLGSAKRDRLLADLKRIIDQGSKVIVFSQFPSIIEPLIEDIRGMGSAYGSLVAAYHGGMSQAAREESKARFRTGNASILMASSTGEKGINLPEATYVINYDLPAKHSAYIQRLNRAVRIGSNVGGQVTIINYIARNTVEEPLAGIWINRNAQNDVLTDGDLDEDDENFITADMRRRLLRMAREGKKA